MEIFSALLALCAWNSPVTPVNSPHKGQWRGALMDSLICTWINGWGSHYEAGYLRRHRSHYDVIVMTTAWRSCSDVITPSAGAVFSMQSNAVISRSNLSRYYITALRWQQQNINQTSNSQQTPHTSPSRAIGCQLGKFWRKLTAF